MLAATAARGLFVSDPDAETLTGMRSLECEIVGGGDAGKVGDVAGEGGMGDGLLNYADVEVVVWHEKAA